MGFYLGIDTSNYKTSIALTDSINDVLYARSEYLQVPEGKRGLRQSEAFFHHSNRLPEYIEELCGKVYTSAIAAVGVSTRPRRAEGSYMPCFLAGFNAAREIAAVLGIPLHEFSHQEGHAAAIIEDRFNGWEPGMKSCRFLWSHQHRSLLLHLSGGTTEFLLCDMDSKGYNLEIVGGTKDISIGQLIDRAGVAMGYPFPSGVYLDQAAKEFSHMGEGFALKDIKVNDGYFNLSGPETAILRKIESSSATEYPAIAYELFDRIAGLLALSIKELTAQYGIGRVYMAGGVASSSFIRSSIRANLPPDGPEIIFGSPALSGDNAVGVARLAHRLSK